MPLLCQKNQYWREHVIQIHIGWLLDTYTGVPHKYPIYAYAISSFSDLRVYIEG